MNSAKYVDEQIVALKAKGIPLMDAAWEAAKLCIGWPYVFGARGDYCDPENRRARYRDDHPTIKTSCRAFDGESCSGCKWYPGSRVRCYDCRGFTYWILKQVYGWTLNGAGATSQWNNNDNWTAKGTIDTVPDDVLVCLFYTKQGNPKVMEHTGLGYQGETIECSVGVQYSKSRSKKWTHWAIPKCVSEDVPVPDPDKRPMLRQGDSGTYVVQMQTALMDRGYNVSSTGADGKFGKNTKLGLIAFQADNGLVADGICGKATWAALDQPVNTTFYTVHIPHLPQSQAQALVNKYSGAWMTKDAEERG